MESATQRASFKGKITHRAGGLRLGSSSCLIPSSDLHHPNSDLSREGNSVSGRLLIPILTMVSLSLAHPHSKSVQDLFPSLPLQGCEFLIGQEDTCKTGFLCEG